MPDLFAEQGLQLRTTVDDFLPGGLEVDVGEAYMACLLYTSDAADERVRV